ncbi:MAG: hypothetical protein V4662_19440 [Verrucomicrobiota bacterium]
MKTYLALFFIIVSLAALAQDSKPAPADLTGTWVMLGKPGETPDTPEKGAGIKVISGKRWLVTQADAETGEILVRHGGTFTITGQEYAEHVEYANASTESLVDRTFKFSFTLEGERLTLIGRGNPWQEVWKRVK